MPTYICTDGHADVTITAPTARQAAQQYVDDGEWGESSKTSWVHVYCTPLDPETGEPDDDERTCHRVEIPPEEPDCYGADHDWQRPHEVVGGLPENPGIQGHGGGVVITEVCSVCGTHRITDTWDHDPETGEEGLETVEYI